MPGPLVAFLILALAPRAYDAVFVVSFCFGIVGLAILWLVVENRHGEAPAPVAPISSGDDALAAEAQPVPERPSLRDAAALLGRGRFRVLVAIGAGLALVTVSDGFVYLLLQRRRIALRIPNATRASRRYVWAMRRALALLAGSALAAALAAPAPATSLDRKTTSYATIGGDAAAPYSRLKLLPGSKRVVRDDLGAKPRKGRLARRRSLLYFAQLSDFQLADEESPARAEVLDVANGAFTSAWRPQEAFEPFAVDAVVRQVNRFDQSPIRNRSRRRARLALTITTGDSADNQQVNEVGWVVRLLEGGRLNPNSGVDSLACTALGAPAGEGARYTGVQDDDDVLEAGRFYDPDRPSRTFAAWPRYPGLMDRAQLPFDAAGLDKPSYVTFGNHDGEVQGNIHALKALDDIARGCLKPLALTGLAGLGALTTTPGQTIAVPADPARGFADRPRYKALHATGKQSDAHGFAFVDEAERAASKGQAAYYAFSPKPGLRLIAINTVAEGDRLDSEGNLDDPQFRWLRGTIEAAEAKRELVMLYGHHPIRSLTNNAPDEQAGSCELRSLTGPGCDLDPRDSKPLRFGADLQALLLAHPNVNRDGTLSLFGTLLDHGATLATPASGTPAASFGPETLAAIARELAYNDPQVGVEGGAEGALPDRNVELLSPTRAGVAEQLVRDPRSSAPMRPA